MDIYGLQNGVRCSYCGINCLKKEFSQDHIIPLSKGGSNSVKNKIIACKKCNEEKSNLFLETWYVHLKLNGFKGKAGRQIDRVIFFKLISYIRQEGENLFRSRKCYQLYLINHQRWNCKKNFKNITV